MNYVGLVKLVPKRSSKSFAKNIIYSRTLKQTLKMFSELFLFFFRQQLDKRKKVFGHVQHPS